MPLIRVTSTWKGGQIGTGFTNLFFEDGVSTDQAAVDAVRGLFAGVYGGGGTSLPSGVSISFPSSVDVIEEGTGILLFSRSVTPPATITGLDNGAYPALAGACVNWLTADIVAGHRVTGRTFFVPLGASMYQNDGTLSTAAVSALNTAAAAFIASEPEFVVWHRPASVTSGGGSAHVVLVHRVADRAVYLTSRR